jgi:hypothetical protein
MTDPDWRETVEGRPHAASGGAGPPAIGILGILQGMQSATNPIDAAAAAIQTFVESDALKKLFIDYLALAEDQRTADVEKTFVRKWAELANESAAWIGHLVRAVVIAPLRSTGPESDFSIVQHIHGPRRQRLSRVTLAAYVLCKRARAYVTEPRASVGITKEGTRDITSFAAPKRSTEEAASSSSRAVTPASSSSAPPMEPRARPSRRYADSSDEEPDLGEVQVTTRSGRLVKTVRAIEVANLITPNARRAIREAARKQAESTARAARSHML